MRIAVYGGISGKDTINSSKDDKVVYYSSKYNGGNGGFKRIQESIKAGKIDKVVILTKFSDHASTNSIKKISKIHNIPCESV